MEKEEICLRGCNKAINVSRGSKVTNARPEETKKRYAWFQGHRLPA